MGVHPTFQGREGGWDSAGSGVRDCRGGYRRALVRNTSASSRAYYLFRQLPPPCIAYTQADRAAHAADRPDYDARTTDDRWVCFPAKRGAFGSTCIRQSTIATATATIDCFKVLRKPFVPPRLSYNTHHMPPSPRSSFRPPLFPVPAPPAPPTLAQVWHSAVFGGGDEGGKWPADIRLIKR